jgi:UDP-N-acetylglucosamine 3-dehydrogenase
MIKVAIIGCGSIAVNRHIPSYDKNPDAVLHGFFNTTFDRAKKLAKKYSAKAYKTLEELLDDNEVEAVSICTPTKYHSEIAVKALNAGKHVLCEKPMASTVCEAKAMVDAARKNSKKLMIAHNQRLYAPHIKAKQMIDSSALGKILTFRTFLGIKGPEYSSIDNTSNNWYFNKQKAGRGVVSDVGSHRIDLIRYFFGDVKEVFAYTPTIDKTYPNGRLIDVDDNAFTILKLKNGITGVLIASWTSYSGNDRTTQIFGTEGVMTIYSENYPLMIEYKSGEKVYYELGKTEPQEVVLLTQTIDKFIESIKNDTEPFVTGEDGLATIKVIEAMVKSNQVGRWVKVE